MLSSSPVASTAPRISAQPVLGLVRGPSGPPEVRLDDHVVRFVDSLDGRGRLRGGERVIRPRSKLQILRQQVARWARSPSA